MSSMTIAYIRDRVEVFGCEGASARIVADIVGGFEGDWEIHLDYDVEFKKLLQLRRGLHDVGCQSLKSLDLPIQATARINYLHHEFERPFIAWREYGAYISILMMIPSPPTLIIRAVSLPSAVAAGCLGIYRMFFE